MCEQVWVREAWLHSELTKRICCWEKKKKKAYKIYFEIILRLNGDLSVFALKSRQICSPKCLVNRATSWDGDTASDFCLLNLEVEFKLGSPSVCHVPENNHVQGDIMPLVQ